MAKIAVFLLALSASVSLAASATTAELPRPSYARTMLKVSRSLPGETEEVKVRTSEGSVATLIVKRREKSIPSKNNDTKEEQQQQQPSSTTIGYRNVEVDPWSRLKTWTSEADEPKEEKNWIPVSSSDSWKPVKQPWLETSRNFQENDEIVRYSLPIGDAPKRTNIGANLMKNIRDAKNVPAEVVVRSEVNVKTQPGAQAKLHQTKRLPITLDVDGTPIVHGRRVPDDPIDKIQVWRNARVINDQLVTDPSVDTSSGNGQSFDRFFEDVNRRYSKSPADEDKPKPYRNEVLAAEIYETSEESYRPSIRKRMLQPEVTAIYPNSRLYSLPDTSPQKISIAQSVKSPGTRTPVLQYAHPELGVQSATKVQVKKEEPKYQPPAVGAYPSQEYGEHRHKKKYVVNDKNIVDSSYNKNVYLKPHYYGPKRIMVEHPSVWEKMTQVVRNSFTDGVTRVSELTKPVFDPLYEATRKISENLGLSRSSSDHAQDKIGTVASGSSVLIPALGLVASGAALGIGAVAVGRYLDVDVLKRSMSENSNLTDEQKERALGILDQLEQQGNMYVLVQDEAESSRGERRKRSAEDDERRVRKGADQIADIVEIEPTQNDEAIAKDIVHQALDAIVGEHEEVQVRRRRSLNRYDDEELSDALQNLENAEVSELSTGSNHAAVGDWTNTPCAKRLFCDAMLKRGSDAHVFMEKKMSGLLRMIQPGAAVQVSAHFDEVMDAVRRHDCSTFSCPQARPASVFF